MAESRVDAGINFDTTQLTEGAAQTVEGLQSIAKEATVTSSTMVSKSQAMADAAKEAAVVVTAADLRIAEAARRLELAKKEQLDVSRSLAKGIVSEADALTLSAVAMQKVRAASLELAEAQEAVAVASHATVTGVQATSGAIRSLEGNAGIRAVENFVSKTLGLGPLMQTLFPVIGALAFGEILFGLGEKFVDMYKKAEDGAKNAKRDFDDLHDKAQVNIDDLRIENDKLDDQIAKLSGHPGDGLQTALDEARKMADKLLDSLQADRKALEALLSKNSASAFGGLISGVAGTGKQEAQLIEDQEGLTAQVRTAKVNFEKALAETKDPAGIKAATDVRNAAIKAAFDSQIAAYRTEAKRLKDEQDEQARTLAADPTGALGGSTKPIDNSHKIANIQGRMQELQDASTTEQLDESINAKQIVVGKAKQDGGTNSSAEAQPESQGMKDMIRQMELDAETAKRIHESLTEIFEADLKQQDEASRKSAQQQRADAEQFRRDQAAKVAAISEVAQAALEDAQSRASIDEEAISANLAEGMITKLGAAKQLAAVHTAEYVAKLKALKDELDALSDGYGGSIDPKKTDQVQGQIAKTETSQTVTAGKDQAAQTAAIAAPYLKAFDGINSGWLKVQNDLIAGNRRISQDFRQMGVTLLQDSAKWAEGILANDLKRFIKTAAANAAKNQAMVVSDGVAAAQSTAIKQTEGLKQALIDAKGAAVAGWKAGMQMGFPAEIVMAPALAAVGFAGAMAQFEYGGVVAGSPGMAVPIVAHAGERVLTASQTTNFESMVNNSKTGGETHFHFGNNYSGASSDVKSQAQQSDRDFAKRITRLHREGKLAIPAR